LHTAIDYASLVPLQNKFRPRYVTGRIINTPR
jgi:hypothetical protein